MRVKRVELSWGLGQVVQLGSVLHCTSQNWGKIPLGILDRCLVACVSKSKDKGTFLSIYWFDDC